MRDMDDIELYTKVTAPQRREIDTLLIIRLSRDATKHIMDHIAVRKPCYFLIDADGTVAQQSTDWNKSLFLAQERRYIIFNPRSSKAMVVDAGMGFAPVRLLFHQEVFDVHPVRGRQLTQFPNQTWRE